MIFILLFLVACTLAQPTRTASPAESTATTQAPLPLQPSPEITVTRTPLGPPTRTQPPPTPTRTPTPTPELLACPGPEPLPAGEHPPLEILYVNDHRVWRWDEASQEKIEIELPDGAVAPHISANGRWIAYLVADQSVDRPEDPVTELPLWLFDRQSGEARQVAAFQTAETRRLYPESPRIYLQLRWLDNDLGPAQSQWLLVEVYPEQWGAGCCGPRGDLYLVEADSGEHHRILEAGSYEFFSVHPDGRQVAALSMSGTLYLINVPPGGKEPPLQFRLHDNPWLITAPVYSPDGAHMAFQTETGLAVVHSSSRAVRDLALENPCRECNWGPGLRVIWQPDGEGFYTMPSMDDRFDQLAETTLYHIPIEAELEPEIIATIHAGPYTFQFSPDRRYLTYWNQPEWDDINAGRAQMNWVSLYLMDLQELQPRRYVEGFVLRPGSWSPDGRRFLYTYSPFGGPNPVPRMLYLGNICQPPKELPVPEGSLIQQTIWLDADRFLAWTDPAGGVPDRYKSGLYLYQVEGDTPPVKIDDIAIDLLQPYWSQQQAVVVSVPGPWQLRWEVGELPFDFP